MRMLDTTLPDANDPAIVQDINPRIIDGLESARQRVVLALQFWFGQWFLNTSRGTPYTPEVLGHQFDPSLARRAITETILGVQDVTGVRDIDLTFDARARTLRYSATVDTIYGPTTIAG